MGTTWAVVVPFVPVVSSTRAVARNLCGLRRWAMAVNPMLPASMKMRTRLAPRVLLRYKFIAVINTRNPMEVNDKAPDFALANEDGQTVSLKDYRGKNLVLFFYPKASTSG
jgi:hypothetical protein